MKSRLMMGVLAVALAAVMGMSGSTVSAQQAPTFSIAVHLAYADGSSYDIVLARGVAASDVSSRLADCGRSHRTGSVVRYHCYAIAE